MRAARTYAVRGGGSFPFDMLRYDGAFPAEEVESNALEHFHHDARTVIVRSHQASTIERGPCADRWRSFGWRVVYDSDIEEHPHEIRRWLDKEGLS